MNETTQLSGETNRDRANKCITLSLKEFKNLLAKASEKDLCSLERALTFPSNNEVYLYLSPLRDAVYQEALLRVQYTDFTQLDTEAIYGILKSVAEIE